MMDILTDLRDIQKRIKSGGDVSAEEFRFIAEAAREERRTAGGTTSGKKASKKSDNVPENLEDLFKEVS